MRCPLSCSVPLSALERALPVPQHREWLCVGLCCCNPESTSICEAEQGMAEKVSAGHLPSFLVPVTFALCPAEMWWGWWSAGLMAAWWCWPHAARGAASSCRSILSPPQKIPQTPNHVIFHGVFYIGD